MPEPIKGISRAEVVHLAGLARIDLSDAELDDLAAALPKILEHVATVQQAAAGDDVEAMSHPLPVNNVFREDVEVPCLTSEQSLAMAPASDQQRFLVPKILGEE